MRLKLIFIGILSFWIILISRVYYLSVISNSYYENKAQGNIIKTEFITPVRGQILDINNNPIAINQLGFSILLAPHLSEHNLNTYAQKITNIFQEQNSTKIISEYKRQNSFYNHDFIKVVEFLDYDSVIPYFTSLELLDNLKIEPTSKRFYPYSSLASHIIGYVGRVNLDDISKEQKLKFFNFTGRSGIEKFYDDTLQGIEGERKTMVNALNKEVEEVSFQKAKSEDIKLTINMQLQQFLTELFDGKAGAVVIIDVKTGAIIGAGSYPEYDLNQFVNGIATQKWNELINDLNRPFTNKLVNGLYPPGSVIKMGVGLSFLNSGKIDHSKTYVCNGFIKLGGRTFRCWRSGGHGKENLVDAIKDSCDVYFYEGSLEVGIDSIANDLNKFGFGRKTGVDLPNEFIGIVPNKAWKMAKYNIPWYNGETVITSIGQGNMLVTPIQIAKHTAEIATGKGIIPHFLYSIDSQKVEFENYEIFNDFEKRQLKHIREGMFKVANDKTGTAYRNLHDNIIKIAAKTGTAQVVGIPQNQKVRIKEEDMEYYQRSHAWLTTYGPFEDPKIAVTVLVEHGGGGGSAGSPIVKSIYNKLFEMGYFDDNKTSK